MSSPFASTQSRSTDTKALQAINSENISYANKDFVKNIAWLNASVDTLSQWSQKLQSGVDQANQNVIDEIAGFASDLFVILAGGEPTGIDIGDLGYVLQAIGAFFGINPDTPFPMNLVEAAQHMLEQFFIPLPQFTDVIFDAVEAWAVDLGLDENVVTSAENLQTAINDWGEGLYKVFEFFSDAFTGFLNLLGLGRPPADTGWFGDLITNISNTIESIISGPRQALLHILSQILVAIFDVLTFVLNLTSPNNLFGKAKVQYVGNNLVPDISNKTVDWGVGVNPNTGWVFNGTWNSFDTNGIGSSKTITNARMIPCTSGKKMNLSAELKWTTIPLSQQFGVSVFWYIDDNQVSRTDAPIPLNHSASGGWAPVNVDLVVPTNVNGFKVGAYVGAGISTGNVSVRNIKVLAEGITGNTIVNGLDDLLGNFLDIFDPLNAWNLTGTPPRGFFDLVPASVISWSDSDNLLENPNFDSTVFIDGQNEWFVDPDTTHSTTENAGSVKIVCDGYDHELFSNAINVAPKHALTLEVWVKWEALISTGESIKLMVAEFANDADLEPSNVVEVDGLSVSGTTGWTKLNGVYHCPEGVAQIRMVFHIESEATSGTVWFSEASWVKNLVAGMMPKSWTDGLDDLNDSVEGWWGDFWDSIFGGSGSTDKTANDAAIAAAAQATTISGNTTQMMQLLAALGRGKPDADDFERWDLLGIGTKWAAFSSAAGGLTTSDAHNAQWISSFDAEYVAFSANVNAQTHVQTATVVLGSAPEARQSQGLFAWNSIWLRCTNFGSWATRTGLRCFFSANQTLELWWFLNGVGTRIFDPVPLPNLPVKGSILEFNAGTNAELMRMTARFNGAVVLDDVDPGISTYGSTQMRRGFGGFNDAGFLLNASCGKVKQWTAVG